MKVLVVAPRIVMASPIVGTVKAIRYANNTIPKVTIKFCLDVNFYWSFMVSSSILSLVGRTQKGAAKRTTNRRPIMQILITVFPL